MANQSYDLVVIGSGPGGEVGVIRAAQLGLKCALIEKQEHLGGTCLNWGCIPTKALLESAKTWTKINKLEKLGFSAGEPEYHWDKIMDRKQSIVDAQRKGLKFLMKKNKIDTYHGHGRFLSKTEIEITDSKGEKTKISAKNVLIATGSKVRELPFAKANGKAIHNSDTVLSIDSVPESLCVVGGGVVGSEFASLFGRFGSKVTVVEMAPQLLGSEDAESAKEIAKAFKKQNITVETKAKLTGIEDNGDHCIVKVEGKDDRKFAKVLVSIGRAPVTDDLGLDKAGLSTTDRGFIKTDNHYRTQVDTIFAIGDVLETPALAHTASAEAMHAVEVIAGHTPPVIDYQCNPNAIYTYPEVASIGYSEQALKDKGIEYKSGKFPFAPMAKAKIEEATEGWIKILFEPKYKEILGVHIVGAKATEMISEFVLGKILETTVDEIGHAIHPHPTLSETVQEAAHAALGSAIHM